MIDINKIRKQFPSLSRLVNNNKIIYLDGPAGTQVPQNVIDGVSDYYKTSNANVHGEFITSKETNKIMDSTRTKAASLLGAESASCISIGQNMTSLCFSLTHAFSKTFSAGDEVVITELDHEANRGPWKILEDVGVIIKEVNLLDDGTLDYEDFENKITNKTVLVAMGMSSNAIGTLNDFKRIRNFIKNKKCYFLLDAVHYAPHFSIDVKEFGCDFLLCSAYKFYGPHIGILYSKPSLLDKLDTNNLIVQNQNSPYKIETGTLNHAACSGVASAIDFISSIGEGSTLREKLESAYKQISIHEFELAKHLYDSLQKENKIKVICVGDNFNDLDMLKNCDIPCLVFNDQFKRDQINIDNLIVSNKPSPEGWSDVNKTALVKLSYKD